MTLGCIAVCIVSVVICAAIVVVWDNKRPQGTVESEDRTDGESVTEPAGEGSIDETRPSETSGDITTPEMTDADNVDETSGELTDETSGAETDAPPDEIDEDEIFDSIRAMKAGAIVDTLSFSLELTRRLFFSEKIGDDIRDRITGISYKENDNVKLSDLRYVRVLHMGFDGKTHIGELIVNRVIANDIVEIMRELYENGYKIERMVLVDEYGGDDETSMSDNNTSAFNYRVVANTTVLSNHALGMAIDINPRYNPYVTKNGVSPANGAEYADRDRDFEAKIDHDDLCYKLFIKHGFDWGGDWSRNKDYQHFEKKD